jgi:arabinan endo-1,5-alpha-L-arabinosidase
MKEKIKPLLCLLILGLMIPSTLFSSSSSASANIPAIFEKFVSYASYPNPPRVDPNIFTEHVVMFGPDAQTHYGRDAVVQWLEQIRNLISALCTDLKPTPEKVATYVRAETAWLSCFISLDGTLKEDNQPYKKTFLATIVYEKRSQLWQIAHIHISALHPKVENEALNIEDATWRVHDPCIIKQNDSYYLFSTEKGIPIRSSKDLRQWEQIGYVFSEIPLWAKREIPNDGNLWAPDISFFNRKYHLYYAVSTFATNRSAIALATNTTLDPGHPDYRWVDQGKVIQSVPGRDDWNAIDPNFVMDEEGKGWLAFGSFWSGIKIVRVTLATGKPDANDLKLFSIARRPEAHAIEAPFIIRKNGHYYLFVSFDQCCRGIESTYKITVGRSKNITGPYIDRSGNSMMQGAGTLVLSGYGRWRGPGHNAVLRDGKDDWLVHHTYDAEIGGIPRLQIRQLVWADDAWPLAAEPNSEKWHKNTSINPKNLVGEWEHSVNFGSPNTIELLPDGTIRGHEGAQWALQGRNLTLRWPRRDAPGGVWTDNCLISSDGRYYLGRNQIDMIIRGKKLN